MDYRFFDPLLDAVFIIDENKKVIYGNEAASSFCEISQKRLLKGDPIFDLIKFDDPHLFVMPDGDWGKNEATPYREVSFQVKGGKTGKVQVSIHPFTDEKGQPLWSVLLRDVTLEEILVSKYRSELGEKEKYISQLQEAQKELEAYSRNLEQRVEERTLELRQINQLLTAIMESLGQGFLVFGADGIVKDIYTRACLTILETQPGGKNILDVLDLKDKDREHFKMWCQAVFENVLPFSSLVELAPQRYHHSQGKAVFLEFYHIGQKSSPDHSDDQQVVLVATDRTTEQETLKALEKEKENARMILKVVKEKNQFSRFLHQVQKTIAKLLSDGQKNGYQSFNANEGFRQLHTLEGEASVFSAIKIRDSCRMCQNFLEPLRKKDQMNHTPEELENFFSQFIQSLHSWQKDFDSFRNEFKEIFTVLNVQESNSKIEIDINDLNLLLHYVKNPHNASVDYRYFCEKYLKSSLRDELNYFEDVIQTVAKKQNKKIASIEFSGEDIRLFMDSYRELLNSLIHIFRNAVDHGIEAPEERLMQNKSETGHIRILLRRYMDQEKKWFEIKISDDGAGISPANIREKLNLSDHEELKNWNQISDSEVLQFIFRPGFTTRSEVNEFSGRGVGMDAVKEEVVKLGGRIKVESTVGRGTEFIIQIPEVEIKVQNHLQKSA